MIGQHLVGLIRASINTRGPKSVYEKPSQHKYTSTISSFELEIASISSSKLELMSRSVHELFTRKASVLICVLTCTHELKSPDQSKRRASVLSSRTSVLICVLMDSPRMSYVLCVLNRQPTWAKITLTVHGKGQRAESKDQRADMCTDGQSTDVLCVLTDSHGRLVCADGHSWTPTDVLQPTWAKITQTVHGKGQRADMCTDGQSTDVLQPTWAKITRTVHGKGQRADMCTDGQSTDVLCALKDSHGRSVCYDGQLRTSQPTWAKITRTVHGKGQHAESKDQRADMCTDGQPWTGRHSSEPTLSPKGYGSVGLLGATLSMVGLRSDGRTVSGEFSGILVNFPADSFAPNLKFSRLCGFGLVSSVFELLF
ncbi:hypothetical protein F2Q68_00011620 [Brassica cretica]|uniref:Uncharacterized protein n=1 Tax=Brassica cretica TaxID=69181 RepID=A0A8S9L187_BRACR|nr:hypothetical protein F2Q68_00011620 [Brassica cretica]